MNLSTIQKSIDVKNLRDWVSSQDRSNIDLTDAWYTISRYYCGRLVQSGKCPTQCETCKERIQAMMKLSNNAKTPGAYLTTLSRDFSARFIEESVQHNKVSDVEKTPETLLFGKKEVNPFLAFLEGI